MAELTRSVACSLTEQSAEVRTSTSLALSMELSLDLEAASQRSTQTTSLTLTLVDHKTDMNPSDFDQHFFITMLLMVFVYYKLRKDEREWI